MMMSVKDSFEVDVYAWWRWHDTVVMNADWLVCEQEWALFEDWYKDDNADDAAATEQEDEASCGGDPVLVELAVEESDKESGGGGVGGAEEVAKQPDALPKVMGKHKHTDPF